MALRDGKNPKQVVHLGNLTLSGDTAASSDWVDTTGFDSVTLLAIPNTVTDAGTAAGFSFEMQENDSTTDAGASAVDSDEIIGTESDLTITADGDDDTIAGGLGYVGDARYVRLTATGTTGTDADVTVIAILDNAHREPPTFVGTSVAAT